MRDDLPAHPATLIFPRMSEDELLDLAADIVRNGLIHPLMLDNAGECLLDGLNRQRACAIANVEPRYERLPEGVDPVEYIYSVNVARRHLTKGQQAIVIARLYPEPEKGGRGHKLFQKETVSRKQLSEAREIIPYPDLADLVVSGALKFDHALHMARDRTITRLNAAAHMRRLREEAPDLAAMVDDEQIAAAEAVAMLEARLAAVAEKRGRVMWSLKYLVEHLGELVGYLDEPNNAEVREQVKLLVEAVLRT